MEKSQDMDQNGAGFMKGSQNRKGIRFRWCPGRNLTSEKKQTGKFKKHKYPFYHNTAAFHFKSEAFHRFPCGSVIKRIFMFFELS